MCRRSRFQARRRAGEASRAAECAKRPRAGPATGSGTLSGRKRPPRSGFFRPVGALCNSDGSDHPTRESHPRSARKRRSPFDADVSVYPKHKLKTMNLTF